MAWSATNWRDRLNDYSGSLSGTRSWGSLGQFQYQGKFKFRIGGAGGSSIIVRHRTCGTPTVNTKAVGFATGLYSVQYRYTNFTPGSYYSFYNFYPSAVWSIYANNSVNYVVGPQSTFNYVGFSIGSSRFLSSIGNGNNQNAYSGPSAFYNYSPWGAGPYTAGANITISNGSQYPYQRLYYYAAGICP